MATHLVQHNAVLPIHFFKIIVETNVDRIKMPNKFTKRYRFGLPNPVCLKTPDFYEWEVHWIEENGEIWFEKGWKEFVENYSLHHGHFVLFKYGGTFEISVLILDQSALEIDYSISDYDDELFNVDRPNSQSDDSRPCEKMRCGTHGGNVERNSKPQKLNKGLHFDEGTKLKKIIKSKSKDVKGNDRRRITSLNTPRGLRAREVAKFFVSNNIFFTVVIRQSQLDEKSTKDVPKFLEIERIEQNVMLQIEERLWPVKLLSSPYRIYARFASGWYLFVKENKLQAGDICIFELINKDVPLLKVHVTKAS